MFCKISSTSGSRSVGIVRLRTKGHGVCFYAKFNPNQHGFTRTKSTVTNLVIFLDFLTPFVCGQHPADAIYILIFLMLRTLSLIIAFA
jgi:hypothetical protein